MVTKHLPYHAMPWIKASLGTCERCRLSLSPSQLLALSIWVALRCHCSLCLLFNLSFALLLTSGELAGCTFQLFSRHLTCSQSAPISAAQANIQYTCTYMHICVCILIEEETQYLLAHLPV